MHMEAEVEPCTRPVHPPAVLRSHERLYKCEQCYNLGGTSFPIKFGRRILDSRWSF